MPMITDTRTLADFCQRLAGTPYITVDTEFMRETTYWPVLCLVQLAGPDEARAVDALAEGIDLKPLCELMADENVLKVFHAARQDMEIFYHLMGALPAPVFDTQIAAMVCGFGDQVGYETLISKLTRQRVDKSSRFTDWSLRPLSNRQIDYAMGDVTHLRPAYEKLCRKLQGNGREGFLDEKMAVLCATETYDGDPYKAYLRIKSRGNKPRVMVVLRELAAWREIEARRRDLVRNRILRDEQVLEIAHHTPATAAELARTRGLGRRFAEGHQGEQVLEAVKRGLDTPKEDWPRPESKPDIPRGIGPITDLLKVLLKMQCEAHEVAQKLLASAADVELIAAFGEDAGVPALHGWRRQVYGEVALKLRNGETALALKGKEIRLVTPAPEAEAGRETG